MPPEISIVIPAFEEEARVGESIKKIFSFLQSNSINAELIVVDDGSRDRTADTARAAFEYAGNIPANVIRYEENRGIDGINERAAAAIELRQHQAGAAEETDHQCA